MKAFKNLVKTLSVGLGLLSLVAMAESYYDQQFYTADFMDSVVEVDVNLSQTFGDKRIVASENIKYPLIQKVGMEDSSLVDGEWIITKVIDDQDNVQYDMKEEKDGERVVINLKLIDLSTVRVDEDFGQTFKISLLTREGTIALFKEFGEGFEIVQAVKVKKDTLAPQVDVNKPIAEINEEKNANRYHIEDDLSLVSAQDPNRNRNILRGDSMEGYAYLKNGELIMENIILHVGTKNQTEALSTEARIKNHGVFNDMRGNQGILTNVSKDEVKVRFSTGVLAGAMLNFVTPAKKQEIEEKFGTVTQNIVPNDAAAEVATQQQAPAQGNDSGFKRDEEYQDEQYERYEQDHGYGEEEYYDEEFNENGANDYVEEADGERINSDEYLDIEGEAEYFEDQRNEGEYERDPASDKIDQTGFSF